MSMEGISLLPLSVVLNLVLLHPFVSFFLFVCGSFIYFSLLITLLYLSWLTLIFARLLSLISYCIPVLPLSVFLFCLSFPPPCQSILNLFFSYFNDNFKILYLMIPFCEEVTVGSKENSFTFLKLQVTIPKSFVWLLCSRSWKSEEVGKEMLMANSENM